MQEKKQVPDTTSSVFTKGLARFVARCQSLHSHHQTTVANKLFCRCPRKLPARKWQAWPAGWRKAIRKNNEPAETGQPDSLDEENWPPRVATREAQPRCYYSIRFELSCFVLDPRLNRSLLPHGIFYVTVNLPVLWENLLFSLCNLFIVHCMNGSYAKSRPRSNVRQRGPRFERM